MGKNKNMQVRKLLLYQVADNKVSVSVHFEQGTFWLTQKALALLFGVDRSVVTKHLKNIFKTKELEENSVCAIFAHTAEDGKNYDTKFYRIEAILAVGYRVNSTQATDFRKWVTTTLNEFIIKGFVLDDERLKQGKNFGQDYFDELLERKAIPWTHIKLIITKIKSFKEFALCGIKKPIGIGV